MPVTGVRMPTNYPQEGLTESSTTSAQESNPTELQLHRVVRARSVCTKGGYHGIHTPTGTRSE